MTIPAEHAKLSLCVSIITYRAIPAQFTAMMASLLAAIHAAEEVLGLKTKVIVIDNAQEREFLDSLCAPFKNSIDLELLSNRENLGYGTAHNLAIGRSASNYYLAMNPDVVIKPDCLYKGIQFLEKEPHVVALSPEIRNLDGGFQYLCKQYPSVTNLALRGFGPAFLKRWCDKRLALYECRNMVDKKLTSDALLISGCFMFCRGSALRQAGGFNERFFLYFEDFALSMELHKIGKIKYFPQISIVHYGGHAARKGWRHLEYFVRSAWIFFNIYGWKFI